MVPQQRYTFRDEARGILPGYSGHLPATKDVMSGTPFGSMPKGPDPKPEDTVNVSLRAQTMFRERSVSPERPQRLDKRGVLPGSTYHVHGQKFQVGFSTQTGSDLPDMVAGVIHR